MSVYEKLARQVLDTRYKLADGTVLTASATAMRTDLTNLAWAVIELEKQNHTLQEELSVWLERLCEPPGWWS